MSGRSRAWYDAIHEQMRSTEVFCALRIWYWSRGEGPPAGEPDPRKEGGFSQARLQMLRVHFNRGRPMSLHDQWEFRVLEARENLQKELDEADQFGIGMRLRKKTESFAVELDRLESDALSISRIPVGKARDRAGAKIRERMKRLFRTHRGYDFEKEAAEKGYILQGSCPPV